MPVSRGNWEGGVEGGEVRSPRSSIAAVFVHSDMIMYASSLYTALSIYQLRHIVYTSRHVRNTNCALCCLRRVYCIHLAARWQEVYSDLHSKVNCNVHLKKSIIVKTLQETVFKHRCLLILKWRAIAFSIGLAHTCVLSAVDKKHTSRLLFFGIK